MSDTPQGPDWWQASDDKWYPPPRPEMPGDCQPPWGRPRAQAAPVGPPHRPADGTPGRLPPGSAAAAGSRPPAARAAGSRRPVRPGPYGAPSGPQAPGSGQNKTPLYIAIGAVAVALVVILVVVLSGGGDDDEPTTVADHRAAPHDRGSERRRHQPPDDRGRLGRRARAAALPSTGSR